MKTSSQVLWQPGTTSPLLLENEIHVWRLDLADPASEDETVLQADELTRFQSYTNTTLAGYYLRSRCQIRRILAAYLDEAPTSIVLGNRQGGKPRLLKPPEDLEFNLSHTGHIGLLAVSSGLPVGIDIEKSRPISQLQRIADRVLDPITMASLRTVAPEQKTDAFFRLWTLMEATQKSMGKGIFAGKVTAGQVGSLQFVPMPGYHAALAWAVPSAMPVVRYFTHDHAG